MEAYFYLVAGTVILAFTLYDFFYTTLSGCGNAYLSNHCSAFTNHMILRLERKFGRSLFNFSGLTVHLVILSVWVLLVWLGLFLVYSYDPTAIVDKYGVQANFVERLYFTGYVLSTLGIGNITPSSTFSILITSFFSFFGVAFFTTAMTYVLSVSTAITQMRSLALSINALGKTPQEIVMRFEQLDKAFSFQQIMVLKQMIHQLSSNYLAYPVVHYYHHPNNAYTLSYNMAALDEAMSTMLFRPKDQALKNELEVLRSAMDEFIEHVLKQYDDSEEEHELAKIWFRKSLDPVANATHSAMLSHRRKAFTILLNNDNRNWEEVYDIADSRIKMD